MQKLFHALLFKTLFFNNICAKHFREEKGELIKYFFEINIH